jgi:photosystem II stability/assembly factor-like uncharacterized protein
MGAVFLPQVACPDSGHCWVTAVQGIAESTDGGATWRLRPLPKSVPTPGIFGLACTSDDTCYAGGTEAVGQSFGSRGSNGGSAMLLITHDGGASWQRVTFPVPASIPAGMPIDSFMSLGSIQCPVAGTCYALGASDQGSKATPVYTARQSG